MIKVLLGSRWLSWALSILLHYTKKEKRMLIGASHPFDLEGVFIL